MLVPWLLLLCGLWTPSAALAYAVASAILAVAATVPCFAKSASRSSLRDGIATAMRTLTLSEALALLLAFAAAELLFELLAGSPMKGWDAFLSWDRWAEELALSRSLGRRAFGFYPPGIPLVGSIFYKILPASGPVPASSAHLLLHGFHSVFLLLLLLAVCALARPLGFNPLVGQALVLSDFFLVQSLLKQSGEADVPLAAFCVAAVVVAFSTRRPPLRGRGAILAAVPAFFAFAFVKGNGFAVLVVVAAALAFLGGPARPPLVLALVLAAPFFIHQAILLFFPALVVHDPLLLALPLETAHTDLFSPGLNHLLQWLRKAGPILGLGGGAPVSFAAFAIAAALTVGALADRRARPVATAALQWFILWYFTGSYDWRNALPAHVLACLAAATALRRLADLPGSRPARALLACAAVIASLALFSRQRLPSLAVRLLLRPSPPPVLALSESERPRALSTLRADFDLLATVPFLRDAPHLLLPGRDYRLVPNGVRGLPYKGADTFSNPAAGDLAFSRRSFFAATKDYKPVAQLSVPHEFGETAHLYKPIREKVPFHSAALPDGSVRLEVPAAEGAGFLEIRLAEPPGETLSVRPVRGDVATAAAALDRVFLPWTKGDVVRLPFWFPDDDPVPPTFVVKSDSPAVIKSVSILK